jgi:hypothetical protein
VPPEPRPKQHPASVAEQHPNFLESFPTRRTFTVSLFSIMQKFSASPTRLLAAALCYTASAERVSGQRVNLRLGVGELYGLGRRKTMRTR